MCYYVAGAVVLTYENASRRVFFGRRCVSGTDCHCVCDGFWIYIYIYVYLKYYYALRVLLMCVWVFGCFMVDMPYENIWETCLTSSFSFSRKFKLSLVILLVWVKSPSSIHAILVGGFLCVCFVDVIRPEDDFYTNKLFNAESSRRLTVLWHSANGNSSDMTKQRS